MNTILQKRIEEAARIEREQCREDNNEIWRGNPTYNDVEASFIKGATFTLQNQWISVEEALPPKEDNDSSITVLIHCRKGWYGIDYYIYKHDVWRNNGNNVTHWMEIPSLKGGEK